MPRASRPPLRVEEHTIRNPGNLPVALVLEPWGERVTLAPGASVRVVGRGPATGALELVWGHDGVVVYAWAGSTIRLEGIEAAGERPTAPRLPHGMPMREWIAAMRAA